MVAKITPISGFPEWLPEERLVELHFIDRLRSIAELHGFASLDTRAAEPLTWLVRGGDTDKELYAIRRLYEEEGTPELGLHFDLTVPLARYVAERRGQLSFPFRRYQIQKVWRGERPQEGRYREFLQADFDVIGDGQLPLQADADMVLLTFEVMNALPLPATTVLVNNRKIHEGFSRAIGDQGSAGVIRLLDKLDKVGSAVVRDGLIGTMGLKEKEADLWLRLATIRTADTSFREQIHGLGLKDDLLEEGLEELAFVIDAARQLPAGAVMADIQVARGLDYYTGTVYETVLAGNEDLGSPCSGGRYDNLVADIGGAPLPGVGVSVGVTRMLGRFLARGQLMASRKTPTCVLVALPNEESRSKCVAIAQALRARGVPTEVFPEPLPFGKQIRQADRRGIPYVWFPSESGDSVRDIRSGVQQQAGPATWTPPHQDLHPSVDFRSVSDF